MSNYNNKNNKVTKDQLEIWTEDVLMQSYTFWPWMAEVNPNMARLEVFNLAVSSQYGFSIDLTKRRTASELKKLIINYGGELLERAELPRNATQEFAEEFLATAEKELDNSMTIVGLDKTK